MGKDKFGSANDYYKAFQALEENGNGIHKRQKALLKVHFDAPNHTTTWARLARAVGFQGGDMVNLQYGRLAHRVAEQLGILKPPKGFWLFVLVDWARGGDPASGHTAFVLRPPVIEALVRLNVLQSVSAYTLLWNPKNWNWGAGFVRAVRRTEAGQSYRTVWSSGSRTNMPAGSRVYLFHQHVNRGIIGAGHTLSQPFQGKDSERRLLVKVEFDTLVPPEKGLPVKELLEADLGVPWNTLFGSGQAVPDESTVALEELWQAHLRSIGRTFSDGKESEMAAVEGRRYLAEVQFQQRNRTLIEEKKRQAGGKCTVCGFDFKVKYKELGRDLLVGHHVRPIGKRKKATTTTLDQIEILCPNCHAAVHSEDPPLTADQLRSMLAS